MSNITFLQLNPEYPPKGYWDQTLLVDSLPKTENDIHHNRGIIIIPGAYQGHLVDKINQFIGQWDKCLIIITSDEEAKFPINKLKHPNMTVWGSYMNNKYKVDRWLPIGYTPHARDINIRSARTLNYFFAGQINHLDREKLIKVLDTIPHGKTIKTKAFAHGVTPETYINYMLKAKFVPCPAGGVNPDSFRVYEALQTGCIPIVRGKTFWNKLLPNAPFPIINEWDELPDILNNSTINYWDNINIQKVTNWWCDFKDKLRDDLKQWMI